MDEKMYLEPTPRCRLHPATACRFDISKKEWFCPACGAVIIVPAP